MVIQDTAVTPDLAYQSYQDRKLSEFGIENVRWAASSWSKGTCQLSVKLGELVQHCFGVRSRGLFRRRIEFDIEPHEVISVCVFGSVLQPDLNHFPRDIDFMVIGHHDPKKEKKIAPKYNTTSHYVVPDDDPFGGYYGGGSYETVFHVSYAPATISGDTPADHSQTLGVHIVYRSRADFIRGFSDDDELSQRVYEHGIALFGADAFRDLTLDVDNGSRNVDRDVQWVQDSNGCLSATLR